MCYLFFMDNIDKHLVTMEEIAKRLTEAIEKSGKTQKEIAKEIGVDASTVSKYSKNKAFPSLDTFARICYALEVSADDILGIKL